MASLIDSLDKPMFYYENIEGGHGGAANNEQRAFMWALSFEFLWQTLAPPQVPPPQVAPPQVPPPQVTPRSSPTAP
jgi:prolyl oligopeptidase